MNHRDTENSEDQAEWQDVEERIVLLIDMGRLCQQMSRNEEAIASFDRAVRICRGVGDRPEPVALVLAQALDNKASALVDFGRLAEAIPVYDEAIRVRQELVRGERDQRGVREIGISVMNKGRALVRLGRYVEAHSCISQAFEHFGRCLSEEDAAMALTNKGDLYTRENSLDDALATFDQSLIMWRAATYYASDASDGGYAHALFGKSDVLFRLGRYDEALYASSLSIGLQRTIVDQMDRPRESNDLADALKLRGKVFTKLGRIKDASDDLREAATLRGVENGRT